MSDYASILNKSWDDIPEEKVLPVGSYLLKSRGAKLIEPQDEGKSARVNFAYGVQVPMDDVDRDELAELGEDYDVTGNSVFYTVFISKPSDWHKVRKHLTLHGVEIEKGETIQDALDKVKGREVVAYLSTRSYTNAAGETTVSNDPTNFAPAEG